MKYPRPRESPIISVSTMTMIEIGNATRRPAKMLGKAAGNITRQRVAAGGVPMGFADSRLFFRSSSTTFAAVAKAASVFSRLPRSTSNTMLLRNCSCTIGAPDAIASRGVLTDGRGS